MIKKYDKKYDGKKYDTKIWYKCKLQKGRFEAQSVQKLLLANFCRVATCGRGLARDARDARDARAADEKRRWPPASSSGVKDGQFHQGRVKHLGLSRKMLAENGGMGTSMPSVPVKGNLPPEIMAFNGTPNSGHGTAGAVNDSLKASSMELTSSSCKGTGETWVLPRLVCVAQPSQWFNASDNPISLTIKFPGPNQGIFSRIFHVGGKGLGPRST